MNHIKNNGMYYVSTKGSDHNPGTIDEPFKTIQKAADIMQPGDSCIVREGVYREWVKPPRGGSSEEKRIVYKAASGERVIIKGSEQINKWVNIGGNVWRCILPDSFFNGYNPFKTNVRGGWLLFGGKYHLGEVYFNGMPLSEKLSFEEINDMPNTWHTEKSDSNETVINANFDGADPNIGLAEINVRECVFFPEEKGLQYITVDGFEMMHSASNWACFLNFQKAMMGTYWGKCWIIQNCSLSHAKCVGLVCGNDASDIDESFDVESAGHHIVRNNIIKYCGQAGITGYKGWAVSVIENNIIEDINCKREFGGYETGGIKLHHAIDITVRNNVIRRVHAGRNGDYVGLWIDWAAQGVRLSGNVIYDMEDSYALFVQYFHGATFLVDNNIFSGTIAHTSENVIFAHNLFDNCKLKYDIELEFRGDPYTPAYWLPHTGTFKGKKPIAFQNDKYFNNIFTERGADQIINAPDYQCDYNVFFGTAEKNGWGDANSIRKPSHNANVELISLKNGVEIIFNSDSTPYDIACPFIDSNFIGTYPLTGQTLENHDGSPIIINSDLNNELRDKPNPAAGPFETIKNGKNVYKLIAGPEVNP